MATELTLFQQPPTNLPAHLAAAFDDKANVIDRETTPALTFRGKTWRMRQGGEEIVLQRQGEDGMEPVQTVQVVVLNLNPKRSRTYYSGPYESGKNKSPDCWSSDGERPDTDCKTPQAQTCASCPMSVKGSKITANMKETTACATVKRLAVVPASKLDMEPMLLKVPQTSMWDKDNTEQNAKGWFAWDQFVDFLRQRGVKHTAQVVTKIKFDSSVEYPKLLFTAARWLEPDEVSAVLPMVDAEATKKLLVGGINESSESAETPAPAVPARVLAPPPAPAPAAPAPNADADEDGDGDGDGFSAPVAPKAAAPKAAAPKAAAPKAAAPKAPPAPPPPVVPPAAAGGDLAALAAEWD